MIERIRPIRRISEIRAQQVTRFIAEGAEVELSPIERFTSREGELGASYELKVVKGDTRLEHHVAIVYGDDSYFQAEGICAEITMADAFRQAVQYMARNIPLDLGSDRRRRYEYLPPPPSWQPVVRTHSVSWYPPDFPKNRSVIRVYDAKPARTDAAHILERRMFELPQADLHSVIGTAMHEAVTDTGLRGAYELVRGMSPDGVESVVVRVALLDDSKRWAYNLRFESCEPDAPIAVRIFDAVARSVMPLPALDQESEEKVEGAIQWSE